MNQNHLAAFMQKESNVHMFGRQETKFCGIFPLQMGNVNYDDTVIEDTFFAMECNTSY